MIYQFEKGKAVEKDIQELEINVQKQYFGFVKYEECGAVIQKFALSPAPLETSLAGRFMAFETYDGFDFISLNILNLKDLFSKKYRVYIYVQKNLLLFIYKSEVIEKNLQEIMVLFKLISTSAWYDSRTWVT